jgi:hypothetical protein
MLSADSQELEGLPSPGCGLGARSPLRSPVDSALGSPSPPRHKRARSVQRCLPIEYDVFHNDKTIKYMKVIDRCKEQGIGDGIELPRVCHNLSATDCD